MKKKKKSILPSMSNGKISISKVKRSGMAFLFLLPAIIMFVYFKYLPTLNTIRYSFYKYDWMNASNSIFVGFSNYAKAFQSELFWLSMWNALELYLWSLVLSFAVPIFQALCLSQMKKGKGVARFLYIIPTALSGFAGLSVWKYMWEPDGGLANIFLDLFGLGPYEWYGSEKLVKFCLRFPGILGGGSGVIMYLVAIQNVPHELYEAAMLDGANLLKRIRYITLPSIKYIVFLMFILGLGGSLLAFGDVYMITQGGPGYSTFTVVFGIYTKAFRENNYGMAMAQSVVVLVITLIITIIVHTIQGRMEDDYGS